MIHYHPFSPVPIAPTAKEQSVEPLLLCGLAKLDEWRVSACLAVRYHLVIVEEFIIMRRAPPLTLPEPLSTRKVKKHVYALGKEWSSSQGFLFHPCWRKLRPRTLTKFYITSIHIYNPIELHV
ncbi:hypothetical protein FRC19_000093 [Serendipita sp. 401]|nr:hypothetical protein FRC19_000093 [Serendipita sp. 401]KAG9058845.1 hypothetical protein FS842_000042 [Serendipita sp. 407]